MILRSILYSVGVYVLLFIIALVVAGIIRILYLLVHKSEPKKAVENKVEAKDVKVVPQ
jgi:hypothetical protein